MRILLNNKKKILVLQGGSGSSKTYSILQYIISKCLTDWDNKTIDVLRRTTPALKRSVLADFFKILMDLGIYNIDSHNKTDSTYKLGTNLIRFYSTDEEQKVRGPRRDIAYFNEALEFKRMDVIQVMMRTHEKIFMDYNPSDEFSWIYDEINVRDDVNFNVSTYLDNPFLPKSTIDEIKRLKDVDPNLWRIYGLGEKGTAQATIYLNWDYAEKPFEEFEGRVLYGMDFGYNDPTTLIKVKYHEKEIYAEQLMYKSELTSDMIVNELNKIKKLNKIDNNSYIYADNARPEIIREIKKAGYNIRAVKKGKDSVMKGIDLIKKHNVYLNKNSLDLIKEMRNYKWKTDKDERILDEPIDLNDHLCDAFRYALEPVTTRTRTITDVFGEIKVTK